MDDRYFWTKDSGISIDHFLQRTKPSIITEDMTPWIWVQGTLTTKEDPERTTKHAATMAKAQDILARLEQRHKEIQEDDSIPTRGKKGVKSKKQTRDETLEVVREELKELSIESGWTTGKWLFFPRGDSVDGMWATIARSVADGPLKQAGVDLAKVASSPMYKNEGESPPHVICTYMNNVYDKEAVGKVLHALLAEHGLEPSACKSDLYTLAGIDSKHPSGIRSSLWRPAEVLDGGVEQIKKLKDQHRAKTRDPQGTGTKKSTAGADGLIDSDSEDEKVVQASKRKAGPEIHTTKPPSTGASMPKAAPPPSKKVKSAATKFQEEDIFAGSDSD